MTVADRLKPIAREGSGPLRYLGFKLTEHNRTGHRPGQLDVEHMRRSEPFWARPNFHYFEGCERPCWLPCFPQPRRIKGTSVTHGYPCEFYADFTRPGGEPFCVYCGKPPDWVLVVGQVRGEVTRNERLNWRGRQESSDVWDIVVIPPGSVKPEWQGHLLPYIGSSSVLAFTSDLWLGNTGWRDLAPFPFPA